MAEPGLALGLAAFTVAACTAGGAIVGFLVGVMIVVTRGI